MPITNGVYTPLTFDAALAAVIAAAPASIKFAPGNPPELILANMFAQADVLLDENNGSILAMLMSPVGSMIDLLNPNNPRETAAAARGYLVVTNGTGSPITIPPSTLCTVSTGQKYQTGNTAPVVGAHSTAAVLVTCTETGVGGNISSGVTFTLAGLGGLTATNPLPFLSGQNAESDALYLNRVTSERTEYGSQNGSVAVETELKKSYQDARIYVNNTQTALTTPVPVPGNGYNLIVKTPSGKLAGAAETAQIFNAIASRLEFVNSQNLGSALHTVLSGTVYQTGVPQNYYFTAAQAVATTLDIVINIRASQSSDRSELITQANDFAVFFINRVMSLLSGIDGNATVTYKDDAYANVVTSVPIAASNGLVSTIAPRFGVATIEGLVNDLDTMEITPQILYDSTASMTIVIDPQIGGQTAKTLAIGGARTFIDFENDALFTDNTSYYDRFIFLDPADITVKMQVVEWM